MDNKVSQLLLSLSETDSKISCVSGKKAQKEGTIEKLSMELEAGRRLLAQYEEAEKEGRVKQVTEEHKLRDEEQRIVERRKQLTDAGGGAKVGKLMEREIDIASKAIETLEAQAMRALEQADQMGEKLKTLRGKVEKIEIRYEEANKGAEGEIKEFQKELTTLTKERDKFLGKIEGRVSRLYARVARRYPGEAVSKAHDGACQSCHRMLPLQTYNQIIAGNNLIQCPGCQRILVYDGQAEDVEE